MFFQKNNIEYSHEDYMNSYSKQLELQVIQLKAQIEGIKEYVIDNDKKNGSIKKAVNTFCRTLFQREFALAQIGGENEEFLKMDIPELLDFTAQKIIEQKKEQKEKMISIIDEKEEKNKIIEDLKNQITQFLSSKDLSKKEILEIVLDKKISKTEEKYSNKPLEEKREITKEEPKSIIEVKQGKNIAENISSYPKKEDVPITVIEIKDEDLIDKSENKKETEVTRKRSDNQLTSNGIKDENKKEINIPKIKEGSIAHIIDLKPIIDGMADIHWRILEAIGVRGFSEKSDIVNFLTEYYKDIEISSLEQKTESALNEIKMSGVILREKVNTGWRTFYVYSLSDTGKRIFNESKKFKEKPVLCERDILIKQHSTIYHGYGIKDSANILLELGYKNVIYKGNENKIELPNGDLYIPDITANDPITGEKKYFEYELVHHKQSDFEIKCNKMRKVTNELFFIVPDINKRRRLLLQIDDWRFKMGDKIKNVKISVTTTRNLKKDMWETDN